MKMKLGLLAALATIGFAPVAHAADLDDRYYYDRSGYSDRGYDDDVYEESRSVVVRRRPVRVIEDDYYDDDAPEVIYYSDTSPRYPYAYGIRPYRFGHGYRYEPRHNHYRHRDTWQARGRW